MKPSDLSCWKCGVSLADTLLPLSRLAKCKVCNADLHACRMCKFYDVTVSNSCTEPVADKVTDKKLKNFCGFFQPTPAPYQATSTVKSNAAKSQLESLFGLNQGDSSTAEKQSLTEEEIAKKKLEELFGLTKE